MSCSRTRYNLSEQGGLYLVSSEEREEELDERAMNADVMLSLDRYRDNILDACAALRLCEISQKRVHADVWQKDVRADYRPSSNARKMDLKPQPCDGPSQPCAMRLLAFASMLTFALSLYILANYGSTSCCRVASFLRILRRQVSLAVP